MWMPTNSRAARDRETERGLVVLEIIMGIAPLLGGQDHPGDDDDVRDVGQMGLSDASKLASGIALILKATLIGLLIAIRR